MKGRPLSAMQHARSMLPTYLMGTSFRAALTTSLVPEYSAGSPTPTFTRATKATFTDQDGVLRTALNGEARFQGSRRVRNLIPSSIGAGAVAAGTTPPTVTTGVVYQGKTCVKIDIPANSGGYAECRTQHIGGQFGIAVGNTYRFSYSIVLSRALVNSETVNIYSTGINGSPGTYLSMSAANPLNWVRYTEPVLIPFSNGQNYVVVYGGTFSAPITVYITDIQSEDVTGQTNQNPAEHVSVGVLSAPYYGAGVDGVKYFATTNGNTVASGVVTEAVGSPIASSTLLGDLPEGAATQLLATADIRNMTTANWTLGATMTRARTSVGADGVANSATRLTAGATAATNIITTTITAAASSRTYSALVKRITGTGPIRLTQDNFATNTDVTASVPADGAWHLVQLNQSQLNAVMGFKLDTNGDAIDVDFNQFETGAYATSRMAATGAARNADVDSYATSGNIEAAAGTVYLEFTPQHAPSGTIALWGTYVDANNYTAILHDATNLIMRKRISGTNYDATIALAFVSGTTYKVAGAWGSSVQIACGGTVGTPSANATAAQIGSTMQLGADGNGGQQPYAAIRNVRIYTRALSAGELTALTT